MTKSPRQEPVKVICINTRRRSGLDRNLDIKKQMKVIEILKICSCNNTNDGKVYYIS